MTAERGLEDLPKLADLGCIKTSLGRSTNDTDKTVESKVIYNTDEMRHETGNETVVEKTTEHDVTPNRTLSKTTETKVEIDEDVKESGQKSVTVIAAWNAITITITITTESKTLTNYTKQ